MTRLPEPSQRRRRTPAVPKRARETFLECLRSGFSVTHAANAAGVSHRRRVYELRETDEEFAAAWADAFEAGTDALRDELRRRAVDGWEEPVVSAGKILGTVRKFSDRLLELELKRRDPAYRERGGDVRVSVTGGDGGPIRLQTGVTMEAVATMLLKAGVDLPALALEAGQPSLEAEVVDETDEPIDDIDPDGRP